MSLEYILITNKTYFSLLFFCDFLCFFQLILLYLIFFILSSFKMLFEKKDATNNIWKALQMNEGVIIL